MSSMESTDSPAPALHDGLVLLALTLLCTTEMVGLGWVAGLYFPCFGIVAGTVWSMVAIIIVACVDPLDSPPWLKRVKQFVCWFLMTAIVSPGLVLGSYLAWTI